MPEKDDFIVLIHKQLTGAISQEEAGVLNAWRTSSADNNELFEEIRMSWELSGRSPIDNAFVTDRELHRLLARVDEETAQTHEQKRSRRMLWSKPLLKYAASIVFLLGLLYTAYYLSTTNNRQKPDMLFSTAGTVQQFVLPDSSVVDLNITSTLHYLERDNKRSVKFSGEGFFHVTPDQSKPFEINTEFATVQVVGTSFNVRAMEEEDRVVVSVVSGIVKVISGDVEEEITVGQQCIVYRKNHFLEKGKANDQNFLSWKTGKIQFENESLQDVFAQLAKTYGKKIQVKDSDLLKCRFTGSFENIRLQQALEILEFNFGIKVKWADRHTIAIVSGGKCK